MGAARRMNGCTPTRRAARLGEYAGPPSLDRCQCFIVSASARGSSWRRDEADREETHESCPPDRGVRPSCIDPGDPPTQSAKTPLGGDYVGEPAAA